MTNYIIQIQNAQTLEWADYIPFPDEEEARVALEELLKLKRSSRATRPMYGLERPSGSSTQVLRLVSRTDTVLVP